MGGPSKITVQMMSGDITEVSASTLADLREAIGRMLQTCPEFVRVLHDEALLEESVDVSSLREVTVTALVTPSVPNVLKALRQSGFSFRGLNEKSTSASKTRGLNVLHAAVITGKLDIVQFLLLEEDFVGVNDLCCDGSGYTALHLAASHGLVDACRELLDCPQVTHQDEHSVKDGTALHIAASAGHAGVVQLLLDSERFVVVNAVVVADQWRQDWRERYGQTALHTAARHGRKEIARILLDHPRFTAVGAFTKAFKDASMLADEAGQQDTAMIIRSHPKVLKYRRAQP